MEKLNYLWILRAAIIVGFIIVAYISINKFLQIKAIDNCAKVASNLATTSAEFNGAVYKICVEDSGYKTLLK